MSQLTEAIASISSRRTAILVTLFGRNTPEALVELSSVLAQARVEILDLAQSVLREMLTLSILFEMDCSENEDQDLLRNLSEKAKELNLSIQYEILESSSHNAPKQRAHHYALTLFADSMGSEAFHQVASLLRSRGLRIDLIEKLSEDGFRCLEILVSSDTPLDEKNFRKELLQIAQQYEIDLAIQSEGLFRRAKRLIVMDMDSTLIQCEVIDEIAREKGVYDQVAAITHEAMSGKLDFDESFTRRVATLKGLPEAALDRVFARVRLTPGAEDMIRVLKMLGFKIALISGGFTFVAERLQRQLGIDHVHANVLDVADGVVTGTVIPPIVNAQRKADLLEKIAQNEGISLDQVIAVGDGANDLLMLQKAGLGIAFNAKPAVREQAHLALNRGNLRAVLHLLGLSSRDLEEAGLKS